MAKREYPTKTTRSRAVLTAALNAHQDVNPSDDLEASLKAVRKDIIAVYVQTLDMTTACANTYFQNRKKELQSSLASTPTTSDSDSVELAVAAVSAETSV